MGRDLFQKVCVFLQAREEQSQCHMASQILRICCHLLDFQEFFDYGRKRDIFRFEAVPSHKHRI